MRPSNLSPCLTPFGKYTQGFVCLNLIYKSSLWLTECVLSHCGGLLGAHPRTRTYGRPKPPPSAVGMVSNRATFAICPPQKHRAPIFFLLLHPALTSHNLDLLTLTQRQRPWHIRHHATGRAWSECAWARQLGDCGMCQFNWFWVPMAYVWRKKSLNRRH